MPNPDVMIIVGVVAALIGGFFFVRYPRWRWHIAIGGLAAAGIGVFVTWYVLFRIDDTTYVADKSAAEAQQAQLDNLFDEAGGGVGPAGVAPSTPAPAAAAVAPAPAPTPEPAPAHVDGPAPKLVGGREKALTPTASEALGTLPDGVGVAVGAVAPDASFLRLDGTAVKVSELTAARPLLLVFYRGGWCPFCNAQVHEFSTGYPRLQELGVDVAFASVDRPDAGAVTKASWEVPFPLLGDPEATAHEAFHVVNALDQAGYDRLIGFGLDVEQWSGQKHHKIAVPAIFLLDTDRTVLWAHAAHDYKVRPTLDVLVPALQAVMARHAASD